jgi:hypothetical protein
LIVFSGEVAPGASVSSDSAAVDPTGWVVVELVASLGRSPPFIVLGVRPSIARLFVGDTGSDEPASSGSVSVESVGSGVVELAGSGGTSPLRAVTGARLPSAIALARVGETDGAEVADSGSSLVGSLGSVGCRDPTSMGVFGAIGRVGRADGGGGAGGGAVGATSVTFTFRFFFLTSTSAVPSAPSVIPGSGTSPWTGSS